MMIHMWMNIILLAPQFDAFIHPRDQIATHRASCSIIITTMFNILNFVNHSLDTIDPHEKSLRNKGIWKRASKSSLLFRLTPSFQAFYHPDEKRRGLSHPCSWWNAAAHPISHYWKSTKPLLTVLHESRVKIPLFSPTFHNHGCLAWPK